MVLLAAISFLVLLVLHARRVRGGALITIILTTLLGIPMGLTHLPARVFSLPGSLAPVAFHFDLLGALRLSYVPYLFAFFLPDFFSSLGTALGVSGKAGFLDANGDLPGLNRLFLVDSVAATLGSLFTVPVMITYLESGAGVEAGGRTGLTAIVAALAFLATLFLSPLALMIPAAGQFRRLSWGHYALALVLVYYFYSYSHLKA